MTLEVLQPDGGSIFEAYDLIAMVNQLDVGPHRWHMVAPNDTVALDASSEARLKMT